MVKWGTFYVRARYGRLLAFTLGFGILVLVVAGFLKSRDVPEG